MSKKVECDRCHVVIDADKGQSTDLCVGCRKFITNNQVTKTDRDRTITFNIGAEDLKRVIYAMEDFLSGNRAIPIESMTRSTLWEFKQFMNRELEEHGS